ncbi:hypothetical protein [Mycobacterium sp. M23085]|uniref:hypothetical protein n=1 Tax=Mycobacterium sp. M23085 TaxID=3378087 RepID=UPI0038783E06
MSDPFNRCPWSAAHGVKAPDLLVVAGSRGLEAGVMHYFFSRLTVGKVFCFGSFATITVFIVLVLRFVYRIAFRALLNVFVPWIQTGSH